MNYVVDVSAALCWVLPRPGSPWAVRLRDEYSHGVHALNAPSIFAAEAASALTKAERQKLIPVGQAGTLLIDILAAPPRVHSYEPLLARAVDISSRFRVGLYDCLYVTLAEREGCQLVTDDQKLIANLKPHFPFIIPLASLPWLGNRSRHSHLGKSKRAHRSRHTDFFGPIKHFRHATRKFREMAILLRGAACCEPR